MAISRSFLLLALTFVVVLLIASEASARDLLAAETVQTKENANAAKVDSYHKGHGHGHHGHYGHGHYGYGHHGHYGHKGHGGYSYHSASVGTNAGN